MPSPPRPQRVTTRNATFQQWQSLLTNRTKRHRAGSLIVQGVRPITLAIDHGWDLRALLRPAQTRPSEWARRLWDRPDGERYELAPDLLAELAERDDGVPELLAVVAMPADDLDRLPWQPGLGPIIVFDRPTQPGNIGTLQRSIDAFGGAGLIVTGHAADPYDPKAVRASTGSCFAVPTVRVPAPAAVLDHVAARRAAGLPVEVWGTDESGESDLSRVPWDQPIVLVVGNETQGMAAAWREACDGIISLPMVGSASSLNAAVAGSIVLHAALQARSYR